jgi:hypothetical protein
MRGKIKLIISALALALILLAALLFFMLQSNQSTSQESLFFSSNKMQISSNAFENNQPIPEKYGCQGEGFNPELSFSGVPDNAKSLVLIMDDPDAPSGTFVHWIMWNINPQTTEISENSVPRDVIQGKNSAGENRYHGPCPPDKAHRYFFKLYALDADLRLAPTTTKAELVNAMQGHVLDSAEFFGLYGR